MLLTHLIELTEAPAESSGQGPMATPDKASLPIVFNWTTVTMDASAIIMITAATAARLETLTGR